MYCDQNFSNGFSGGAIVADFRIYDDMVKSEQLICMKLGWKLQG